MHHVYIHLPECWGVWGAFAKACLCEEGWSLAMIRGGK